MFTFFWCSTNNTSYCRKPEILIGGSMETPIWGSFSFLFSQFCRWCSGCIFVNFLHYRYSDSVIRDCLIRFWFSNTCFLLQVCWLMENLVNKLCILSCKTVDRSLWLLVSLMFDCMTIMDLAFEILMIYYQKSKQIT